MQEVPNLISETILRDSSEYEKPLPATVENAEQLPNAELDSSLQKDVGGSSPITSEELDRTSKRDVGKSSRVPSELDPTLTKDVGKDGGKSSCVTSELDSTSDVGGPLEINSSLDPTSKEKAGTSPLSGTERKTRFNPPPDPTRKFTLPKPIVYGTPIIYTDYLGREHIMKGNHELYASKYQLYLGGHLTNYIAEDATRKSPPTTFRLPAGTQSYAKWRDTNGPRKKANQEKEEELARQYQVYLTKGTLAEKLAEKLTATAVQEETTADDAVCQNVVIKDSSTLNTISDMPLPAPATTSAVNLPQEITPSPQNTAPVPVTLAEMNDLYGRFKASPEAVQASMLACHTEENSKRFWPCLNTLRDALESSTSVTGDDLRSISKPVVLQACLDFAPATNLVGVSSIGMTSKGYSYSNPAADDSVHMESQMDFMGQTWDLYTQELRLRQSRRDSEWKDTSPPLSKSRRIQRDEALVKCIWPLLQELIMTFYGIRAQGAGSKA